MGYGKKEAIEQLNSLSKDARLRHISNNLLALYQNTNEEYQAAGMLLRQQFIEESLSPKLSSGNSFGEAFLNVLQLLKTEEGKRVLKNYYQAAQENKEPSRLDEMRFRRLIDPTRKSAIAWMGKFSFNSSGARGILTIVKKGARIEGNDPQVQ